MRQFDPATMRRERRRAGFTLTKLASCIGVSDVACGQWERGLKRPGATYVARMADCLGVPLDALFVETGGKSRAT